MKKIKRIVTMALVACMSLMLMAVPSFAATTSSSDTGSVTINGLTEGASAYAYQIARATYDEDGNFLGYEMTVTPDGTTWKINSDGSWDDPTEEDLSAYFYAVYDRSGTNLVGSSTANGTGTAVISDLPVGAYIIYCEDPTNNVMYSMMIGSVSYETDDRGWTTENGTINVSGSNLWVKAATPIINKEVKTVNDEWVHGDSENVGDEVTYHITVSNLPQNSAKYAEFYVEDNFSGISLSDEQMANIKITATDRLGNETVLIKDVDYTIRQTRSNTIRIDFTIDELYTLNDYAGGSLLIEYKATIDSKTSTGAADHYNEANLTFVPSYTSTSKEGGSDDAVHEYTFSVNAKKTDKDNNALAGATFALYTDSDCEIPYTQNDNPVTATSTSDGTFSFSGLATGTYYMKETDAPAGYIKNNAVYKVVIDAQYNEADGTITSWCITITDSKGDQVAYNENSADTGLAIVNTETGLLPSMGGRGTLIITLIGCAVVAGGVIGATASRKKKAA